jgi:hypothetical protein
MKMTSENVNLHITLKSSAVKGPPIYGETTVTRRSNGKWQRQAKGVKSWFVA